jgi:hypothetical protein
VSRRRRAHQPNKMKDKAPTPPKKTQAALPSGRTNAAGLPHLRMMPSLPMSAEAERRQTQRERESESHLRWKAKLSSLLNQSTALYTKAIAMSVTEEERGERLTFLSSISS